MSQKRQGTPVFTPLEAAQVSLRSNAWFLDLFLHDSMSASANLSKKLSSGSRLATTVTGSFCNSFYGPFFFLRFVDHSVYPASQIFISPSVSDFIVSQHLANNCQENTNTVNLICALLYFSNNISELVSENTKVYL